MEKRENSWVTRSLQQSTSLKFRGKKIQLLQNSYVFDVYNIYYRDPDLAYFI